jgi:hypothetical protein
MHALTLSRDFVMIIKIQAARKDGGNVCRSPARRIN